MTEVRPATPDDAPELVRLRTLMFTAMAGVEQPGPWQGACEAMLRERIGRDPGMAVFVVDAPDGRLAACAAGWVETRLPSPGNTSGRYGHVNTVATDPAYRRRGYSRRLMAAVLDWLATQGCHQVDLHATAEAEGLYRSLGFTDVAFPALRWQAPAPAPRH